MEVRKSLLLSIWFSSRKKTVLMMKYSDNLKTLKETIYPEDYNESGSMWDHYPVPAPIFSRTSRQYATYNTSIPDQYSVSQFIKEFDDKWMGEGKEMPQMLTVSIPNDHGANDRPDAGYPFRESYMVDNDLAVGRIVEYLSHTPYWKNMAIVITEDDAQNGVDHIDAHRSI